MQLRGQRRGKLTDPGGNSSTVGCPGPDYLGLSFLILKVGIKTYLGLTIIIIHTITITDHLRGGVQVTCSIRSTQRFPGEGCSRNSPKMRGRWTSRTTQKPGLLGAEELGLRETHLLPLIEEGTGPSHQLTADPDTT